MKLSKMILKQLHLIDRLSSNSIKITNQKIDLDLNPPLYL